MGPKVARTGDRQRARRRRLAGLVVAPLAIAGTVGCDVGPPNFTVDLSIDAPDALPGDGVCEIFTGLGGCSLRAAISEANALGGEQIVEIAPGVNPILASAPGANENANANGDLDILGDLVLRGAGNVVTTAVADRLFDVSPDGGAAVVTIRDTVLTGGTTTGSGGAVRVGGTATLTLLRDSVVGNSAASGGGVSVLTGATATIMNTTVAQNDAITGSGGGVRSAGLTTLSFATVVENSSATGGALTRVSGTMTATTSIVADQAAGPDCGGPITSAGYNIESGTGCGLTEWSDQQSTDPMLSPLIRGTHFHPGTGSPAIDVLDAGEPGCDTSTLDQRGQVRLAGGACDAGAIEVGRLVLPSSGNYYAVATTGEAGYDHHLSLFWPASPAWIPICQYCPALVGADLGSQTATTELIFTMEVQDGPTYRSDEPGTATVERTSATSWRVSFDPAPTDDYDDVFVDVHLLVA